MFSNKRKSALEKIKKAPPSKRKRIPSIMGYIPNEWPPKIRKK